MNSYERRPPSPREAPRTRAFRPSVACSANVTTEKIPGNGFFASGPPECFTRGFFARPVVSLASPAVAGYIFTYKFVENRGCPDDLLASRRSKGGYANSELAITDGLIGVGRFEGRRERMQVGVVREGAVVEIIQTALETVRRRNPGESEFLQAVEEVFGSLGPILEADKRYAEAGILERIAEPERMIMFRVTWVDDQGRIQVNRGYRIQFNSAIGPYKGGLRFHPSVNLSILKFLGFEQVFKNSLTTLPMGGAKGGSDFNPKGKSDAEVMRFCQAFMSELYRHIGSDVDVPAGDIGVGGREIGFMFGQYRKLRNEFTGVLTGKGLNWGGSLIRPEATGYGSVYFALEMLATRGQNLEGKVCAVSGSGNVAQYTVEKIAQLGGKAVTLSDSDGAVYDPDGIDGEKLAYVMELKNVRRGRIAEYAEKYRGATYLEGENPWSVKCDCAFPSATQNEIGINDAVKLTENGCFVVSEGANMPTTLEGAKYFVRNNVLYGPGKAANAGGVAVSGLEMSQNSMRAAWTRHEVDAKLHGIMREIHRNCRETAERFDRGGNYLMGANIAGFIKVADSMIDQGVV